MPASGRLVQLDQLKLALQRLAAASTLLLLLTLGATTAIDSCEAATEERTCRNSDCDIGNSAQRQTFSHPKVLSETARLRRYLLAAKRPVMPHASSRFQGLFAQEHKKAHLRQPGQQPAFGALVPWHEILSRATNNSKLLHLIRHGQAVSNAVQAYVGEDAWKEVTTGCSWRNASSGIELPLFDPPLTKTGREQASALHDQLLGGSTRLGDLIGKKNVQVVVSPLTRTLETYGHVLAGLEPIDAVPEVDEYCRERFGHNTCDARRPASKASRTGSAGIGHSSGHANEHVMSVGDGRGSDQQQGRIQCPVDRVLQEKFPGVAFPIAEQGKSLGLVSDEDVWWKKHERETDAALKERAHAFLTRIFEFVEADVVFVVSHSGMIGAILAAMGREAYPAQNAELVPAVVTGLF